MDLSQEIALITGASSGFGAATARLLAAHGCRVILCARNTEALSLLVTELTPAYAVAMPCDLRDRNAFLSALNTLPPSFQDISVLVNNAGLALGLSTVASSDFEDWNTMIQTNIYGVLHATHALLPKMLERQKGYIFNIGSIAGKYAYRGANIYGATKAFLKQFSMNLRSELLGTPLRVTLLEPGMAQTNFSNVRFKGDAGRAARVYENLSPLKAEDIAETILWCLQRPPHVNMNRLEIMPVCQAPQALATAPYSEK